MEYNGDAGEEVDGLRYGNSLHLVYMMLLVHNEKAWVFNEKKTQEWEKKGEEEIR